MARKIKTSNVLKLLNLPVGADVSVRPLNTPETTPTIDENNGATESSPPTSPPPLKINNRRKKIIRHMKPLDTPHTVQPENPALKIIAAENGEAVSEKLFTRSATERQIVSVPLMLINEQLGTAVERFNSCACDECLRGITDSALNLMPPMYIRVVNSADEDEVNRLISEQRAEVIRVLAKICIAANMKPFHDK